MVQARGWIIGLMLASGLCSPLAGVAGARAAELSPEVLWDGGGEGGRDACLRAGGRLVEMAVAHARPFRSENSGVEAVAAQPGRSALCVFGALALDTTIVTGSTWRVADGGSPADEDGRAVAAPFGGLCAEECDASLTLLTDADREALIALPERVRTQLATVPASAAEGGGRVAREAAAALGAAGDQGNVAAAPLDVSAGEVDCTWRRFRDGRVATEPTQRCRIGRDANGAPTLEQMTGTSMDLRLEPLTDRMSAYLGRVRAPGEPPRGYEREASNAAAGNRSGLAVEVGNQVHLVGADEGSGFSVLTLSGN